MTPQKRTTVFIDSTLHKALRERAAETDQTVSELVNDAVRLRMLEDAQDLRAFGARAREPRLSFETGAGDLKPPGRS